MPEAKKFKGKYEVKLEFPEGWGWGVLEKIPFMGGGMDIFWNYKFQEGERRLCAKTEKTCTAPG